jgi:hypothetical protein
MEHPCTLRISIPDHQPDVIRKLIVLTVDVVVPDLGPGPGPGPGLVLPSKLLRP